VTRRRPALFRGRHFEDVIIFLCVRSYLRYSFTYRDLEEIMAERNLPVDHVTIGAGPTLFAFSESATESFGLAAYGHAKRVTFRGPKSSKDPILSILK
jgi:hypothetical protein